MGRSRMGRFTVTTTDGGQQGSSDALWSVDKSAGAAEAACGLTTVPEEPRISITRKGRFKILTCLTCDAVSTKCDDERQPLAPAGPPQQRKAALKALSPRRGSPRGGAGGGGDCHPKGRDQAACSDAVADAAGGEARCSMDSSGSGSAWSAGHSPVSSLLGPSKPRRHVRFSDCGNDSPPTTPLAAAAAAPPPPHAAPPPAAASDEPLPPPRRYRSGRFSVYERVELREGCALSHPPPPWLLPLARAMSLPECGALPSSCPLPAPAAHAGAFAAPAPGVHARAPWAPASVVVVCGGAGAVSEGGGCPGAAAAAAAACWAHATAAGSGGPCGVSATEVAPSEWGKQASTVSYSRRGRFLISTVAGGARA